MKLSIVVPIYNVAPYIEKCAKSLLSQSANKDIFEVIFVNDGTTDDSIEILHETIDFEQNRNFFLVEKENGGLSSARNYGMKYITGEYVWFVDSDDWVDENAIEKILPYLNNVDALHFPTYYREDATDTSIVSVNAQGTTGRQITSGEYQFPVQFTIYKTEFLTHNNLEFQKGILMEDLHFTPRALYLAKDVKICKFPVYHYLQRAGGIMLSDVSKKRIYDRIWISKDLFEFSQKHVSNEDVNLWSECIAIDVNAIMYDACRSNDKEILDIAKSYINKERQHTYVLKFSRNFKNRIWYYISLVCFGNFYHTYRILYKLRYR